MPGAMHRMGVYLGLVEDGDYGDYDGGDPNAAAYGPDRAPARREDYAEARYSRESKPVRPEVARPHDYTDDVEQYANGHVPSNGYAEDQTYQITALHPRTYNEARTIGEHFRKNTPVIMNLSEMDDADAKRLVDFAAGLTFGLHGRIERVTAKVFLLSPHNVTVTAQDKAKMVENGFFNQS
ncbi:MAG: cell division protein SepF [Jatrophihabitantaceae bacterium]